MDIPLGEQARSKNSLIFVEEIIAQLPHYLQLYSEKDSVQ
jgi:hypothetical protein